MDIHWVRIIESGHMSTVRLFELGLSFGVCKRMRRWPSLKTINSFLMSGVDDGALGTDIEWQPCELAQSDYEQAVSAFMAGESFTLDTEPTSWQVWFAQLTGEPVA